MMMETITVKFVVAAEQVIADIKQLGRTVTTEKYGGLVQADVLEHYISSHFNEKTLTDGINNFSSQWLVAYAGEEAVGFARVSSKGKRPAVLQDKRSLGILTFCMLQQYSPHPALLEKCIELGKQHEAVWLPEYVNSPLLAYFEQYGFHRAEAVANSAEALPLPFVYMVKA